ncbi:NADPH-dependent F420 reductase [Salinibacterium soli]|uniref:NAD(P)-binding domain-containing protein n=1 Tax=Antiquaquibacter soli TaxID=3064523 RepID=A0ABT9BLL6_9MICO|nr:NAD(P)-binding domain-containing protein [Protaetiibacter sp. WY-16]MDO7881484.1 NAD(P)-binding domain-containing protein [Protaetiibacter sp. WY-16]
MTTIGFIGAGNIGSSVARAAIQHGYDVVLSNSRGPETLEALVADLGPHARAATPAEAAEAGDLVVVTIPLGRYREVPVEPLAGKTVLDTNNYYPQRDGHIAELDEKTATSSRLLQHHLPTSHVVKAFNHIGAAEILSTGSPAGTPNRRALALAGDDADSVARVTALYDELGFDAVPLSLDESWRVETNKPAYGIRQNRDELVANLARATR